MNCPKCGAQTNTKFCPHCGTPLPVGEQPNTLPSPLPPQQPHQGMPPPMPNTPQVPKKRNTGKIVLGVVAAFTVISILSAIFGSGPSGTSNSQLPVSSSASVLPVASISERKQPLSATSFSASSAPPPASSSKTLAEAAPIPEPPPPAPAPQSRTVYITKTGEKYHADGCRYLKKSKIAISIDQAMAQGYTPCSVCGGG